MLEHDPLVGSHVAVCMHIESGDENCRALAVAFPFASKPPTTRIGPDASEVAVPDVETAVDASVVHDRVAYPNRSPPADWPPATSTEPFGSAADAARARPT